MNFEGALKILRAGGKVTCHDACTFQENYIFNCNGTLRFKSGSKFHGYESCLSNDWKEYKEPRKYLDYEETFRAFLDGKKITSEDYTIGSYFYLKNGEIYDESDELCYPSFYNNYKDENVYIYEDYHN